MKDPHLFGFIIKEYYLHWYEVFWESLMLKVDTIVESRVHLPRFKYILYNICLI